MAFSIIHRLKLLIDRLSLQKKLVGLYIIIIMIPIMTFTLRYTHQLFDSALKDVENKNEHMLEIEKIHILNNIETIRRTAQMIVADRSFIDYVKYRNDTNISDLIDFNTKSISNVSKLQFNNPTIENIHVYTSNPYITEMWPILFREKRILDKPWLNEVNALNGTELWWFEEDHDILGRQTSKNQSKISLLREIEYPKDEHLGIIEVDMLLYNFFPKMFSSVKEPTSEMIVIDAKGNIIQNPYNNFLKEKQVNLTNLKKSFEANKKKTNNSFLFKNENTEYMVVSVYIDGIDSYMLNLISLEGIYKQITKTRYMVLVGIVVLIIILSLLTNALTRFLLKRMMELIESMKRVEKGDFSVNVDISDHNEIGQLATHFRNMLNKINELITEAVNKQAAKKEAELSALKTQIDSHFLYNTLENIKMMAEIEGNYQISDSVTSLGEMMRYNLKWKNDVVMLKEEIEHIRNYINIMDLRLDGGLTLKVEVPPDLKEQEVLKMSLQPIIENSVKHGIRPNLLKGPGIIEVRARIEEEHVFIEVEDNGVGMTMEQTASLHNRMTSDHPITETDKGKGNGIGLRNLNERITLYYGNDYGIEVISVLGEGTTVIIKLPYRSIKGAGRNV